MCKHQTTNSCNFGHVALLQPRLKGPKILYLRDLWEQNLQGITISQDALSPFSKNLWTMDNGLIWLNIPPPVEQK